MRILIYGDSNSWGFLDDGQGLRYDKRWPMRMKERLATNSQSDISVIEECLPGRTTAYPDPLEGPEYNGLPFLKPALLSHAPLDVVLIMLGTNDMKARFAASADDVTDNLITLGKIVRRAPVGAGKWRDAPAPKLGLIAPANLGMRVTDPQWLRYEEWLGGAEKMQALPQLLDAKITKLNDEGVFFADANEAVRPSMRDPIHWDEASHHNMGDYIADKLSGFLATKIA